MSFCWLFGCYSSEPPLLCHCWGCGILVKTLKHSTCCCSIPLLCMCRKRTTYEQRHKTTTLINTICCLNTLVTQTANYKQTSITCGKCYEKILYQESNTGANKNENNTYLPSEYI